MAAQNDDPREERWWSRRNQRKVGEEERKDFDNLGWVLSGGDGLRKVVSDHGGNGRSEVVVVVVVVG